MTQQLAHYLDGSARFVCALLGAGLVGFAGCHDLRACYDRVCDEPAGGGPSGDAGGRGAEPPVAGSAAGMPEPDTGGAGAGGAGAGAPNDEAAGAAGHAPGNDCAPPFADCDESSLTHCETDLSRHLRHCGKCGAHCSGFCADSECHALEVIKPGFGGIAHGGISVGDGVAFALADPADFTLRHLIRFNESSRTDNTLQFLTSRPEQLLQAPTRLYLFGGPEPKLWRIEGNLLKVDELPATSIALIDGDLYVASASGVVVRPEGATDTSRLALPDAVNLTQSTLQLASEGQNLILLTYTPDASPSEYVLFRLDTSVTGASWQPLGGAWGRPERLRVTARAAYVLSSREDTDSALEARQALYEYDFNAESRLLLSGSRLADFAIEGGAHLIAAAYSPYGIQVQALSEPDDISFYPMNVALESLELSADYLYVSSNYDFGLARLPAFRF